MEYKTEFRLLRMISNPATSQRDKDAAWKAIYALRIARAARKR